jgi:hypothetical protein
MRTTDGSPSVSAVIADPVFILGLPCSFGPLVGTMLGQHPQMYALPETHLFLGDTLRDWWDLCAQSSFHMAHGLLRAVAQIYFGEQTDTSVLLAGSWLRRRLPFTSGYVLELLGDKVSPRLIIEKSPSMVFHIDSMERAHRMFPQARFIHLVQHPRGHGDAIVAAVKDAASHGPIPQWLLQLACFSAASADEHSQASPAIDPQHAWHALNTNICQFLDAVPDNLRLRVRGEDVLASPRARLRTIADWLGLYSNEEAMEEMEHPERSPYACFGPLSASYGNDPVFLQSPALPPAPAKPQSLKGPLTWREDAQGFLPEVRKLAQQFGYE